MKNFLGKILGKAIKDHFAPGITIHVTHAGKTIYSGAYGHHTYDSSDRSIHIDTIFDIASVTKAIVATGILLLVDREIVRLPEPLSLFFPELQKTSAGEITLWHLLTHTSGLHEIRMSTFEKNIVWEKIINSIGLLEVNEDKEKKVTYANINMFLLGEIVVRVFGKPLDVFLKEELLEPLGMLNTSFNPSKNHWDRIPPTSFEQNTNNIRIVHDPSARYLGGVCGHAGLFSTVLDLTNFLEMWMNCGLFQRKRFLSSAIVSQAIRNQTENYNLRTGLGWHMDNKEYLGDYAPPGTFFHPGFTGSIIAVSPSKQMTISLLSNQTFSKENDPLRKRIFFRRIFDEIFLSA